MTSKVHAPLRAAIVHMLDHNDALNKLFTIDKLAVMCNIAAGLDDEGIHVTTKDLCNAFKNSNDATHINAMCVDSDTEHVLRYRRHRPAKNNPFITSVGRFVSTDVSVGKPLTKTVRVPEMAEDVKSSLKKFLQSRATKKRKADDKRAAPKIEGKKKMKKKKSNSREMEDEKEKERRKLEEDERFKLEEKKKKLEANQKKLLIDAAKQLEVKRKAAEKLEEIRQKVIALNNSLSDLGSTSTRSAPMEVEEGGRRLYYILDGRAGFIHYPEGTACVLNHDIQDGLHGLPDGYGDDYDHNQTRRDRAYELHNYGATQFFLPKGASAVATNHQVRRESSHDIQHNLHALFSGEKSTFSEDALRIAAVFNAQGYGASDETIEMITVGWTKALLEELDIKDIDASSIAKGCPSRRTFVRNEASLAADCMIVVLQEIMDDGAKHFAIITDHGKRAGLEHFVKILVWAGWEDEGKTKKIIKFHCLDVDTSAHDADGCADAVKKSLEEFSGLDDFKVTAITGDAGGGASVHNLLPALVKANVVGEDTVKINCLMHALNKCLESAGQDTFGEQGINKRTPYQLLYVFNQLWKAIKEEGGNKRDGKNYLDESHDEYGRRGGRGWRGSISSIPIQ